MGKSIFMNDPVETLIDRIKSDLKRNREATITKEDANLIRRLRIDHWRLKKRFRYEHFFRLEQMEREQKASMVLQFGTGDTNDRRKQALEEMGIVINKKNKIKGVSLLRYYANLISGTNPFTSEKDREKLSKKQAVAKIADELSPSKGDKISEEVIIKKLQRASTRLKKLGQLPNELKGVLPPNWPQI
jgi:hypothetical protein